MGACGSSCSTQTVRKTVWVYPGQTGTVSHTVNPDPRFGNVHVRAQYAVDEGLADVRLFTSLSREPVPEEDDLVFDVANGPFTVTLQATNPAPPSVSLNGSLRIILEVKATTTKS